MKAAHFGSMDVNYRPEMVHLRENNKWEKADFIDSKMLRNRVEHLDSRNLSSQYEKDIRSFNILSELATLCYCCDDHTHTKITFSMKNT